MRNAIDPTVEPCDDFYQFACGSWLKTHVIPEDKSSYGAFTQLRDDVSIKMKGMNRRHIKKELVKGTRSNSN